MSPLLVESIGLFGTDPEAELADARRVRIRGPRAGRPGSRPSGCCSGWRTTPAASACWRLGGAILLLDALFLGLLFGGGSAGATARPHSSREPIDLGGPARHLHAALQHGPDRWPAGLLPRRAARIRRGKVASTTVGILTATYFLAELVSPPSGTCRIATARTGSCRSARFSEWWQC